MKKTLIALTLAATAAAGVASAAGVNAFEMSNHLDASNIADLGMVRAAADGVVEISDLRGNVLGSTDVVAGVNGNVRVEFNQNLVNKVLAELKIDGETVASQIYIID